MRRPLLSVAAPLVCLLALSGCMFQSGGITTITNTTIDGRDVNATRALIADGHGEFDCVKSATGQCHYVLFLQRCAQDDGASSDASTASKDGSARGCDTRVVQTFSLSAGKSKLIGDLPAHLKLCVSHDALPVAPGCAPRNG